MSWGTINAALNRLVREGVITAFKTNLADRTGSLNLHVIVTADGVKDKAKADEVKRRVVAVLEDLGEEGPTVTVDRSGTSLHSS